MHGNIGPRPGCYERILNKGDRTVDNQSNFDQANLFRALTEHGTGSGPGLLQRLRQVRYYLGQ